MRVLYLADVDTFNASYRAVIPAMALRRKGHDVELLDPNRVAITSKDFAAAEVVVMHRCVAPAGVELAQRAKAAGAALVWDNDDLVTDVPGTAETARRAGGLRSQQRERIISRLTALADLVTTPSAYLADLYGTLGASRALVIENFLPQEHLRTHANGTSRDEERLTITWVAGGEHSVDAAGLAIDDVLETLLREHEELSVVSIGLSLGIRHPRYSRIPVVSLADLGSTLAAFDLGIAPLVDIPFNRARSNIKLKEYSAAGLVWLASPIGPYGSAGKRQGGRLVADDDWYVALSHAIQENRRAHKKAARRAQRWASSQGIDQNISAWENAFSIAVASAATRS